LKDLATWDFGVSLVSGTKITTILAHEFGSTLTLALSAVLLSVLIGPPVGVYLALSKSKAAEKASVALSVAMRSVPSYVIGILLILLFSVGLGWLPAAGCGALLNYVLPSLTLALPLAVVSIRITRASLISVMSCEYYEFSQLKGLSWFQSLWAHGLRNMAIPVIAYHGVQLIYLIEGLVIVETLFAWPGIGHSMVHAVFARDIPMLQGTAMTLALSFVFLNTILDVVYRWVDPRGASK
jgi:peptide/nickel transport system permease protein